MGQSSPQKSKDFLPLGGPFTVAPPTRLPPVQDQHGDVHLLACYYYLFACLPPFCILFLLLRSLSACPLTWGSSPQVAALYAHSSLHTFHACTAVRAQLT